MLDFAELIAAFPNLAFGFAALWVAHQVYKERIAAQAQYAASLAAINDLYMKLLEKAITAIETNTSQSSNNGDSITRVQQELAVVKNDIGGLRELFVRFARDSGKRSTPDRGGSHPGTS